jgi:hypothetical protein
MDTIKFRTELCAKANSLKGNPEFSDTLSSEDAICKHLQNIPSWNSPQCAQGLTLLDLQLRQFLVILHVSRTYSRHQCSHNFKSPLLDDKCA